MNGLFTVGQLSRMLDMPTPKLRYLIETEKIRESDRVGIYRLYDTDAAEHLRAVLRSRGILQGID